MRNNVRSSSAMQIMLTSFLVGHEMRGWLCMLLLWGREHDSSDQPLLLAWCIFFPHALNASLTKEPLAAYETFQYFLLVCALGWGPRGRAVATGSLSMVLTDHQNSWPEFKATLMSSVPYKQSAVWPLFVKVRLILEHLNSLFFPPGSCGKTSNRCVIFKLFCFIALVIKIQITIWF